MTKRYAEPSKTKNLNPLYDPYVKAILQASDRVQGSAEGGVVAFVTNGGFIESNAFDGFRKAIAEEFHAIYCFNLRGDQRTAGEKSKQEGGKIFGSGSRAGVAILLLVKMPGPATTPSPSSVVAAEAATQAPAGDLDCGLRRSDEAPGATIYYRDIGDYLSREQKLEVLAASRLATTDWQTIIPDRHHDWIGQRNDAFPNLRPLAADNGAGERVGLAPIFNRRTLGLATNRDAWCYASSERQLQASIQRSVDFYNAQVVGFLNTKPVGKLTERSRAAKAFATEDERQFHWTREKYRDLANGVPYTADHSSFAISTYRPFFKQHLYFNRQLIDMIRELPQIYPSPDTENLGICLTGLGLSTPFHTLMTRNIPDLQTTGNTGYFSRWRYVPGHSADAGPQLALDDQSPALTRISNINSDALDEFRVHYRDQAITEDDLFYYTYGVLHSPQWRETFANDLQKSHARIPMAASGDDFRAFVAAGRQLADLHVNYETVEPWPLQELWVHGWDAEASGAYRVEKMSYAGRRAHPDKSRIIYNAGIMLTGIPEAAHEYQLGSRSALDWLLDRYQVRTHKASGIVNDPNDWCAEQGEPRYILDLVKRVTTVSVRTVEIVKALPAV